ncbi:hypothetical protein AB6A40_000394 [Gnathostoma spinigerum]|uniref:Uncharacterized protein n=1 Tax=Gnathostoma spinigerum TaxID=75299 RepID=A0ABD6E214_9BILA
MGVVNSECKDHVSAMTTAKPRERQFQVVPVPGRFTRGRWTCWDYKDADTVPSNTQDPNIIEYSENKEKEKDDSVSPKASNAVPADTPLTAKFTVGDIPEIAVEPSVSTAPISMNVTAPMDVPGAPRESSTILVTSVAVAPSTPVHGTPSSLDVGNILDDNRTSLYPQSPSELVQQATVPMVEIGINSAAPLVFDDSSSIMLSPPLTGSNAATVSSTSSLAILGGVLSSQATVSSPTSIATNIASPPAVLSSVDTSQASATTLAQPSPLSSFTETTQSATSIKAPSEGSIPDESYAFFFIEYVK